MSCHNKDLVLNKITIECVFIYLFAGPAGDAVEVRADELDEAGEAGAAEELTAVDVLSFFLFLLMMKRGRKTATITDHDLRCAVGMKVS